MVQKHPSWKELSLSEQEALMKALGPDQTIEIRVNNNEVKDLRELKSNPNINVGDIWRYNGGFCIPYFGKCS